MADSVSVQLIADDDIPDVNITLAFGSSSGQAQTNVAEQGSFAQQDAATTTGNAPAWDALFGVSPIGSWTVTLDKTAAALLDAGHAGRRRARDRLRRRRAGLDLLTRMGSDGSTIALPSGGGALSGIGETFQPDLHTGTAHLSVPFRCLPAGPA